MWKFIVILIVFVIAGNGQQVRQATYYQGPAATPYVRPTPKDGVIKSLEARIVALEEIIKEFEAKEILIKERELALERKASENKRRIRERETALDKREQEITAYQNAVFKQQDEREQELEKTRRGREYQLDLRERDLEVKERQAGY